MSRGAILFVLAASACAMDPELDAFCAESPVVTWDNFGSSFVTENCQTCHAQASENRNGAPKNVVFDTEEETLAWSDRILDRVASDTPTMPPQGGVTDDDREFVDVWLSCAAD